MRLTGTLLDIENYSGTMRGDDGQDFAYEGIRLHVLDGREVARVKVPKELRPGLTYERGDEVDLAIQVAAATGNRGAYLTVNLIGDYGHAPALSSVG